MRETSKPAVQSVTLWGVLITLLGTVIPLIQTELANMPPSQGTRWVALGVSAVGAMIAGYGRLRAQSEVSGLVRKPRRRRRP